jgi:hypothetical protein
LAEKEERRLRRPDPAVAVIRRTRIQGGHMDDEAKVVAKWARGGGTEVRLTKSPFNGYDKIDLRLWMADGKPTRKGIQFNVSDVPQLIGALNKSIGVGGNEESA